MRRLVTSLHYLPFRFYKLDWNPFLHQWTRSNKRKLRDERLKATVIILDFICRRPRWKNPLGIVGLGKPPTKSITKTRLFKYIENFTSKNWNISDKNSDIFHISAQNKECGYSLEPPRRGGSNEYPQSMFLGRNKKNNVYPCKPQFYHIKVGFKGVKIL